MSHHHTYDVHPTLAKTVRCTQCGFSIEESWLGSRTSLDAIVARKLATPAVLARIGWKLEDGKVVEAMGAKFRRFAELAELSKRDARSKVLAERTMAELLETMTPAERLELRAALVAAGKKS